MVSDGLPSEISPSSSSSSSANSQRIASSLLYLPWQGVEAFDAVGDEFHHLAQPDGLDDAAAELLREDEVLRGHLAGQLEQFSPDHGWLVNDIIFVVDPDAIAFGLRRLAAGLRNLLKVDLFDDFRLIGGLVLVLV